MAVPSDRNKVISHSVFCLDHVYKTSVCVCFNKPGVMVILFISDLFPEY